MVSVLAAPAFAAGQGAQTLELTCAGDRHSGGARETYPFSYLVTVDLSAKRICLTGICLTLTEATPSKLAYRCDADLTHQWCEPTRTSAGPYVRQDTLEIDLASGAFFWSSVGMSGDRTAGPYDLQHAGKCTSAR